MNRWTNLACLVVGAVVGHFATLAQPQAEACNYYRPVVREVVVKKVVEVQPVYVASFFAVPVAVPQYSVGYAPPTVVPTPAMAPAAAPTAPVPASDTAALLAEVKRLRAELDALKGKAGAMPPAKDDEQAPSPGNVVGLFSAKCGKCHEASVAANKGKGFTLLQGNRLAPLTDRQVLKMATQTYKGTMPKGGQLTDEEVGAIQEWADGVK